MDPEDFGQLWRDVCEEGENLAFAVVVQGIPQKLLIRSSGRTGASVINKVENYFQKISDLRFEIGAPEDTQRLKVLVVFSNLIPAGTLSLFRQAWYRKWGDLCIRIHGRGPHKPMELVRSMEDMSIAFQIDFDFDTLDIIKVHLSKVLRDSVSSPGMLRAELLRVNHVNEISRFGGLAPTKRWRL